MYKDNIYILPIGDFHESMVWRTQKVMEQVRYYGDVFEVIEYLFNTQVRNLIRSKTGKTLIEVNRHDVLLMINDEVGYDIYAYLSELFQGHRVNVDRAHRVHTLVSSTLLVIVVTRTIEQYGTLMGWPERPNWMKG